MNRQKFMSELEILLQNIPENDRLDAIAYYNDYFDEAGKENEELVIRELGSPEKVADTIKEGLDSPEMTHGEYTERGYSENSAQEWKFPAKVQHEKSNTESSENKNQVTKPKKDIPWIAIVVLLILASPILIGILGGLFGGLVGLLGAMIGVTVGTAGSGIGLVIGGLVIFILGFIQLFGNPMFGLTRMGVGALLISLGILLILLFVWLVVKWLPALVKGFVNACKYVYRQIISLLRRDEG